MPYKDVVARRASQARYRANNVSSEKNRTQLWRASRRRDVINLYGGVCVCCGETELSFLTIDHVNGGGKRHIRSMSATAYTTWLLNGGIKRNGFQVLCWNCNCGRSVNGGVCPHKAVL